MVDSVSAEARRKELLDESLGCVYPEDVVGIKQRYKDTSLVLFKEQLSQHQADNRSFLSFGTRRSSAVSEYGNTPIIVRKSRSANGELSKVGEQWPSLRGKSSLSNYTLHEGKELGDEDGEEEEEEEETETEEEVEFRTKSDEDIKAHSGFDEKRKIVVVDGQAVCSKSGNDEIVKDVDAVHENNESGVKENRKSFSHYDLQQRPRDYIDEEVKDGDIEDAIDKDDDDDDKDAVSMRTVLEVEGVDHKIVLVRPTSNKNETSDVDVNQSKRTSAVKVSQTVSAEISQKDVRGESEKNPCESQGETVTIASVPSKSDQNTVHNECVEEISSVNNVSSDRSSTSVNLKSLNHQSSSDWSKVELRIIEPSDLCAPGNVDGEGISATIKGRSSLASTLLRGEGADDDDDDDDDVVYIDEYSPSPRQRQNQKENCVNSGKKKNVNSSKDESQSQSPDVPLPTPPKRHAKQSSEPSSDLSLRSPESKKDDKNGTAEELDKSAEGEDQNGLLALPVRSPTPPKRSPRRSPRTPKSKEKNHHERHSSLDLPKNFSSQSSASKSASVSASPAARNKESSKIFNISIKKERSRSVSSLSSKKNKEKEKVARSESEDPGAYNATATLDFSDDAKCDTPSGKRVGIRSMVIDGTIKRNFIVIHPSDESETIGLAPLSSFSNGSKTSVRTSKALSSVKSHITGIPSGKVESVNKTLPKHTLKGSIANTTKDKVRDRESLHTEPDLETTKLKKSSRAKKQTESHVHASTVSLSSTVSHINSKVVIESSEGMSEVDCDLVNISTQGIPTSSTKTTSRLCVIM
ncbi:streptococcal hemagglutinin-like [Macrobrachium rosenbergii]|uniref:streptococcal hemagglutinin-like n=1 Tax=Macrobrachium rosenbergii TaxID=79674 RepID=UPI0034D60748